MPRRIDIDVDLDTADGDGIADANATVEATGVDLDGVLTSGGSYTSADGLGHIITITDAGTDDQSSAVFTLTGTDANDQVITEDITGPESAATVVSTKFYKTLTSVTLSGTVEDTDVVDIGTRGTTLAARSKAVVLNHYNPTGAQVALDVTGTCNVDILLTYDDLLGGGPQAIDNANWIIDANLAGETDDQNAQLPVGVTGVMLEVNTYSSGAEIQMTVIQPNY